MTPSARFALGLGGKLAALSAAMLGAAMVSATVVAAGCSDDEHKRTSPEQALGGGGACEAAPGQLPAADCDSSEKMCTPAPGCSIDEGRCGSKSTCLPIGDNKGKDVLDFRIRRLNIASPPALTGGLIQNTVINLNIDMDDKACGETGKGLFNWLIRVDKAKGELYTGGAPPPTDPLGQGYCFANFDLNGQKVTPFTSRIEITGNTFKTVDRKFVNIPIFLSADLGSAILLPISEVQVSDVTLSDDGNCIGRFVEGALSPTCVEDRTLCPKWQTSGALGGYITLEEADAVLIRDLNNKSLCSFLASDEGLTCTRDAATKAIVYKGDYCSKDKQAGSCADSVWLSATFAASAAKIFDGAGSVAACSGAATGNDAGSDAATEAGPSDGGAD